MYKWYIKTCMDGEGCWCREIFSTEKDVDGEDMQIVSAGAVGKEDAELIVLAVNKYNIIKNNLKDK